MAVWIWLVQVWIHFPILFPFLLFVSYASPINKSVRKWCLHATELKIKGQARESWRPGQINFTRSVVSSRKCYLTSFSNWCEWLASQAVLIAVSLFFFSPATDRLGVCNQVRLWNWCILKEILGNTPISSISLDVISSDMMYSHMRRAQFEEALYCSHPEASQG